MVSTVTIDGRGTTVQEALREMRARMQPLEAEGFYPISEVEIVDAAKNTIIESFGLTDPEFMAHLGSDEPKEKEKRLKERPHAPERKEPYAYLARITLES